MTDTPSKAVPPHRLEHIRIEAFRSEGDYRPPRRDMSGRSSGRNREFHGRKLAEELARAFRLAHELLTARDPEVQAGKEGVYLEVESAERGKLPNLNWTQQDIRLGATRLTEAGAEVGVLFVPATAEPFLDEAGARVRAGGHLEGQAETPGPHRAGRELSCGYTGESLDRPKTAAGSSRRAHLVGVLVLA